MKETAPPPQARKLPPLGRKLALFGHLAGFGLVLGGTLAVVLMGLAAEASNEANRIFIFESNALLLNWVVRPGFVMTFFSGALLSFAGPFGFVRWRWMVAKLLAVAIVFIHCKFEYRPLTEHLLDVARQTAHGAALPADWSQQLFHYTRVGVIQLAVALVIAALGVFKPGGRTRWGK